KAKLASPTGRAERLAKDAKPAEAKIRELYLVAFAREPRPSELKTALDYLTEIPMTADGQPIDATKAARENFQDLIWALINTKEFLFNH
ncbi:MAG TPA: S-layer protein, partial [Pirellulaceae bacterium]|nr:S-layer protein [Pirellulaceae bacterium]